MPDPRKRRAPKRPLAAPSAGLGFPLAAALLLAGAIALYWSALGYPLAFDDYHVGQYAGSGPQPREVRWLSTASFWLINAAFGAGVIWQRLANVVLHAAAAVALFGFFARLFAVVLADGRGRWLAFAGAAWFVLHPVAVYGVAYVVERSIVLATLFGVLALWCVLEALVRRAPRWYAGAAAAYALALFCKEHAVMLPALAAALALLIRGPSRELMRRLAVPLAVALAIAAVVIVQRRELIGAAYEPFSADFLAGRAIPPGRVYALSMVNQATLFFRYLGTWFVPWPGWMWIDIRTPFPDTLLAWPYGAGFAAWLAYPLVAGWLLLRRGALGLAGFGLLWPWLLALTEFAAVRVQEPFVLYRSYLWMCGLPALLPAVATPLGQRVRYALAGLIGLALVLATHERLQTFASPLALWDDAVRKNADLSAPYVERAYVSRGLVNLNAARLQAAAADLERALELNPRSPDAHLGRGTLRLRMGELAAALEDLDRAISLDPRYASAYDKRCVVEAALGRNAEALADCQRAVELDPRNDEAWINAGVVYRSFGRVAEAAASYEHALALRPRSGSAHYNYGVLLLESGRRDQAVRRHFIIACEARIAAACELLRRSR